MPSKYVTVVGSFIADLAFRTPRLPAWGETVMGSSFKLGPGGKGSNQAVAAARLGAATSFVCKLGNDPFGELALRTYKEESIDTRYVFRSPTAFTGTASIVIDEVRGENAIVVVPGSGYELTRAEVEQARSLIAQSAIFVTCLEVAVEVAQRGLELAHEAGVPTILNPAPAAPLPAEIFPLCDYLTPNESEAAALAGLPVSDRAEAEGAAAALLKRGARNVVITLGAQGALVKTPATTEFVPAIDAGPVVETTGAGDAFNGGLAVALSEGMDLVAATRFACAVAAISVTRPGTAPSMPRRNEVEALLARSRRQSA
jgi:ribokinase